MLIVKGNYLLLSHLPTSHTTVRAVPHTEVPILGTIQRKPRQVSDSLPSLLGCQESGQSIC